MNFVLPIIVLLLLASCTPKTSDSTDSSDSTQVDALAAAPITEDPNATYVVESIEFKGPGGSTSNVPHVRAITGNANVETEINNKILEFFDITSFDPTAEEYFSWSDVIYTAEIGVNALALKISATYMAAYPTEVEEVMLISLADGQLITNGGINLPSLFKVDGFFPFMEKYWVPVAQPKFKEATECAEEAPGCSMYDIKVSARGNVFVLTLESESCYPHAGAACAPEVEVLLPLDKAKPYLSDFGLKVISSGYFKETSALKQYELADQLRSSMPTVLFMRIKRPDISAENDPRGVGFVYPEYSIALQFEGTPGAGTLSGYLDMDKLPEDFRSTDTFTLSDERLGFTGTWSANGFTMTRNCEVDEGDCEIRFNLGEYSEGSAMIGKQWLSCDFGTVLYAGCSNVGFFDSMVVEEDRN